MNKKIFYLLILSFTITSCVQKEFNVFFDDDTTTQTYHTGDRQIQGNLFLINRIHSGLHTNIGGQTTQEVYFQDYFLRFFLFSNF